ncbi:MAG: hypothetical protein HY606_02510 [Planctomycetes bacterium]|nr:hypothetical protein [Planctomycetota bacterium]
MHKIAFVFSLLIMQSCAYVTLEHSDEVHKFYGKILTPEMAEVLEIEIFDGFKTHLFKIKNGGEFNMELKYMATVGKDSHVYILFFQLSGCDVYYPEHFKISANISGEPKVIAKFRARHNKPDEVIRVVEGGINKGFVNVYEYRCSVE